ncbi:MAG: hypothetical protein ISP90_01750 [Nevskia sp.]|nr:hypothetical protein [Nevskia sp.]
MEPSDGAFDAESATPDGGESHAPDVTHSITHAAFVEGLNNRTIEFTFRNGEPIAVVEGARRTTFIALVAACLVIPILAASLLVYHEKHANLLLGFLIAGLIASTFARGHGFSIGGAVVLALVIAWVAKGVGKDYVFFALCTVWGYLLFKLTDHAQHAYATQTLIGDPKLFAAAVDKKRILIVHHARSGK